MPVADQLLTAYWDRLINRSDVWVRQVIRNGEFGYFYVTPECKFYRPLDKRILNRHLSGGITLSLPALDEKGMSKWCAWDCDTECGAVPAIAAVLSACGFTTYREAIRPGREGHLWLLLDEKIPAGDLLRFNQEILSQANVDASQIEFFPKSAHKLSQLRAPLGIHRKPEAGNAYGWFKDAPPLVVMQLSWLARRQPNDSAKVLNIVRLLGERDRGAESSPPRIVSRVNAPRQSHERLNLVEYFGDRCRRKGNELVTQCPLCAAEGHDRSEDNLRISDDGSKFCCVFGGPGQVHKAAEIIKALTS